MTTSMSVRCHCGNVSFELHGEPVARAICHCPSCRDFYGASIFSATAWPADAVRVTSGQMASFAHPTKKMSKFFCANCGDTLFGTNRLGMRVVLNSVAARAAGGRLPGAWSPTMHLFYRHRIVDVADELPKYLDGWDGPVYEAPEAECS